MSKPKGNLPRNLPRWRGPHPPGAASRSASLYVKPGWTIESMEMRAAGALDDGREFQDVRVYIRESPAMPEPTLDPDRHTEATRARIREQLSRGEGL